MLNVAAYQGRLTDTPQLKVTQSGVSVCSFTIACERNYAKPGEERQADFIDCVAYRTKAEFICKWFTKGTMILINGSTQTRNYLDSNNAKRKVTECVVENATFCGKPEHKTEDVNQVEEEDLPF